jgi:hypothetical protein
MDGDIVYFRLNGQEYIEIKLPKKKEGLFRFDEVIITFNDFSGHRYTIYGSDFIIGALLRFEGRLSKVLNCSLELDSSIDPRSLSQDIGYLWNEDLQGKHYLVTEIGSNGTKRWIGLRYLVWSTPGSTDPTLSTWLYNWKGKIYLEITPNYRYRKGKKHISYSEFIKNYRPLIMREIGREIAQEWLSKIDELLKIIEANDRKIFKSC